MENASKALLIAAAVLIVVLLIAFGMRIFNQSATKSDVSGTASAMEVAQFNAQFTQYEGTISPSVFEKLLVTVNNSNAKEKPNGENGTIVYMKNKNSEKPAIYPSPGYAVSSDNASVMNVATLGNFTFGKAEGAPLYKSYEVSFGYGTDTVGRKRIAAIYVEGIE